MHSPMRGVTVPIDGYDSSSSESEEDSSSSADELPESDQEAHIVTSARVDALAESAVTTGPVEEKIVVIHARAYQIEMFEKSLQQNIIVVMDTGSGKTQVAVLRIQAELKKCSDKIIWFLAPTVALCEQQYRVIKSQIGAAQIKLLSGADNVDAWSSTRIWDDYLKGVHVVVSTYQILLDAILHAFIQVSRLGLIVFDEAHNCTGKHPGSQIMEQYRIQKNKGMPCPAILGLTASPIMRSRLDGIDKIEQTLDAVCKTPTTHREDLMKVANRPTFSCVPVPESDVPPPTASMTSLSNAFRSLDMLKDPYILYLRRSGTEKSLHRLQKALEKRETHTTKQVQSLYRKSAEIHRELGSWASGYFIRQAVTRYIGSIDQDSSWSETWETAEKEYLANILRQVEITPPRLLKDASIHDLSSKFNTLVRELRSTPDGTRCIIFVLETATVAVLARMLSTTASVGNRFRVGTMIGTSHYPGRRRDLGELNELNGNLDLEKFRTGKLDLLVTTSVAEEGIDVPSCDLVLSFNAPANLKSFIQRRGRARMENSRFILLLDGSTDQHQTWLSLEDMMRKRYEDDTRVAHELAELEELDPDPDVAPLRIPSTGAQLDFDQAKAHLAHFCQKITSGKYVDHHPYYIAEKFGDSPSSMPSFSAVVHLPPSLPPELRRIKSLMRWHSEKNAFKDAAFQAFKAIYDAGLVNDNLMPLINDDLDNIEARSPTMEVNGPWKPWGRISQQWEESNEIMQREFILKDGNRVIARFEASLPCHFPRLPPFKIYWDMENTWTIETSDNSNSITASALKEDQSAALIHLAYGHRWEVENSPHILHLQSTGDIPFRQHVGQRAIGSCAPDTNFLVRDKGGCPYIFIDNLLCKPPEELVKHIPREAIDEPIDVPWLALRRWSQRRRVDWLHPIREFPPKDGRYPIALPASQCTLDTVDHSKVCFGNIMPSIVHILEIHLVTEELCNTILKDVGFSDTSLVTTAISSRAAREQTDYERLEFLGDSNLKLLATVSVMIQHPIYPEGYLSSKKDRIVANSRLCRASVEKGLDRFILTQAFTGKKWRPFYRKNFCSSEETPLAKRELSTKTLADVVESLIGAAFVDGGLPKTLACLRVFLPDVEWYDLSDAHKILFDRRNIVAQLPSDCEPLEELIGYTFRNKALLMESISHGCLSLYTETSMERLEFLGDSILDTIIVSVLWEHLPELSNNQMHLLKTVSVNADLLGFLAMEWHVTRDVTSISPKDKATIVTQEPIPFWKFMRHRSYEVSKAQQVAESRHAAERELVLSLMVHGTEHPWAQLAHLNIPKFFSDMFESVLGAVWVDSGSMETCKQIVERIGILPYLRRILSENVEVRHPKNKLGEYAGCHQKRVRYETDVRVENGERDLFCKVFVNDEFIVEANGGLNPEEIVTKAADKAYHMLRRRAKRIRMSQ
ncbi:RNase3 domain-containing protein [Xylaria intraflava]|nr:RNase3 domain-containing protein [Xylaria intraflava]